MEEELFEKLRYCFMGGYMLPQYCVDNNIKRPLFVLEKDEVSVSFLREIFSQFIYDKRLMAEFCFINNDESEIRIPHKFTDNLPELKVKNLSAMKLDIFDAAIFLTKKEVSVSVAKIIRFSALEVFCVQRVLVDIPVLNFLKHYPKVKFFLTNTGQYKGDRSHLSQMLNASELQRVLMTTNETPEGYEKYNYTNKQFMEIIFAGHGIKQMDGTSAMRDDDTKELQRIKNGKRVTAYQPETFQNRIYIFGTCHQFGVFAPYDKTISSWLQKMLNEHNLPYRVENEGQGFTGRVQDMYYNLNKLKPAPGDIILFYCYNMHSNNDIIPFCDISDAFDGVDGRDIHWEKGGHVNELGYKLMAEKYFKFLTENNFFHEVCFNYPLPPPPRIIDMVYLLGASKAA